MDLSKKLEELKPYQLNCNVFDVYSYNGLTMQDLLCQFFTKINECITVSNETIDLAKWLVNEGLEIEVVKKLMIWLEDGTLENIINVNLFNTLNDKINGLSSQLEQIISNNYVNVIDFGADPTGLKDSTSSIREAIKSIENGVIYFPRGYYRFTNSVVLKSGITIKGESRKSTFICPDLSVMGVTDSSLGVTPCFRTSQTESDISIYDIGFDCLKFNDDTKVSSVLFSTTYILDNFEAKNLYGLGQYQLLKFNRGENYIFENIHCDSSKKILPVASENILSFAKNNNIIINNIICKDSVEIIDFSDCDTCFVNNVIGYSQFSDENEAIDVGGSRNITLKNIKTYGFGEGIKLKQEGVNIITDNILIKDCEFNNFNKAGIELLTNYELDNHVISNIKIDNCKFISNVENARGIYNIFNKKNYGAKNISIENCEFNLNSYAINITSFKNISIINNKFVGSFKYATIHCEVMNDAKDKTQNGDVAIKDNTFNVVGVSSSNVIILNNVNKGIVTNNTAYGCGVGSFLNPTNILKADFSYNKIDNYDFGIRYEVRSIRYVNELLKVKINDNNINNCNTSIRFSIDCSDGTTDTILKGFLINNNDIINDTLQGIGILLRGNSVTNGFNNIQVLHNRIYNTNTPVSEYKFTKGDNCKIENYIY